MDRYQGEVDVAVNCSLVFPFFWSMVIYANELETKEHKN